MRRAAGRLDLAKRVHLAAIAGGPIQCADWGAWLSTHFVGSAVPKTVQCWEYFVPGGALHPPGPVIDTSGS